MRSRYFRRLLWLGSLTACIPLMLSGLVFYRMSVRQEVASLEWNNQLSLTLIEQAIEDQLSEILKESYNLAMDPSLRNTLADPGYDQNYVLQLELLNKLTLDKYNNSLIKDLYYYQAGTGIVLSTREGAIQLHDFRYRANFQRFTSGLAHANSGYFPDQTNGNLWFAMKLPLLYGNRQLGLLVFQLDAARMVRYVSEFQALTMSRNITVTDPQNRILLQTAPNSDAKMFNLGAMDIIDHGNSSSGSFLSTATKHNDYYSYVKSNSGHLYISAIPNAAILAKLAWIKWMTVSIVGLFLVLGVLISFLSSRRAYSPIEKLLGYCRKVRGDTSELQDEEFGAIQSYLENLNSEKKKLAAIVAQNESTLLEGFLQRILEGKVIFSTLKEECERFGLPWNMKYTVVSAKIEGLENDCRFRPVDRPLAVFAMMNVLKELLDQARDLKGYVLHGSNQQAVIVLFCKDALPLDELKSIVHDYAQSALQAMKTYLKLTISIGIGRRYPHIADMQLAYRESRLALQYQLSRESEPIQYIEDCEIPPKHTMPSYPLDIESRIVESLRQGDTFKAEQILNDFHLRIKPSQSYYFIYQSYQLLLASIITSIEKNGKLDLLDYDLFDRLKSCQTTREINEWFSKVLFPLYVRISTAQYNTNGKLTISKVREFILEHIRKDISLSECAEHFHMNSSYLSRLFKKEVGQSFLDYVIEVKIMEVKKQLINTEKNIGDIASEIGYSHRTLDRVFQRVVKMSPSDYRLSHR